VRHLETIPFGRKEALKKTVALIGLSDEDVAIEDRKKRPADSG
jgi:hypothetical protein